MSLMTPTRALIIIIRRVRSSPCRDIIITGIQERVHYTAINLLAFSSHARAPVQRRFYLPLPLFHTPPLSVTLPFFSGFIRLAVDYYGRNNYIAFITRIRDALLI